MVITNVYLDNLYCFNDFSCSFTYPKKIVNSTIKNEFLDLAPNFKYKKANIIIGPNASGKTCFGEAILSIFVLLTKKAFDYERIVSDKNCKAKFEIEIIDDNNIFYLIEGDIVSKETILVKVVEEKINFDDIYVKVRKKVKEKNRITNAINYLLLDNNFSFSREFFIALRDTTQESINLGFLSYDESEYLDILNKLLKTLDPSIKRVAKSSEITNCIIVETQSSVIPIENGKNLKEILYLSSGTKYALVLANIIFALKFGFSNFIYIDERFSNLNSDVELNLISLLIDLLPDCSQLFITTHNVNVLDMNLPIHSFNFLTNHGKIALINAAERIIKNNVSVKNQYENNRFENLPNTIFINEI